MRPIALMAFALVAACNSEQLPPVHSAQPLEVSLVQLLANPRDLDGQVVRVVGFCHLEFEGNALYLHREDFEQAILKNSVWVDIEDLPSPAQEKLISRVNNRYVMVEGTVDSSSQGHLSLFTAMLRHVTRIEPSESRATLEGQAAQSPAPACMGVGGAVPEPRRIRAVAVKIPATVGGVVRGALTHSAALIYDVTIGEAGDVRDVRLIRPLDSISPELDQACRTAILGWRYAPTLLDGKPISVCMTVTVTIDVR
jgi:hypothetical protein